MADVGPPRHAIESDDEDEFNPLSPQKSPPKGDLDFEIVNAGKTTAKTLIFASLEAGRQVYPRILFVFALNIRFPLGFGLEVQISANNRGLSVSTRNACVPTSPSPNSLKFIM